MIIKIQYVRLLPCAVRSCVRTYHSIVKLVPNNIHTDIMIARVCLIHDSSLSINILIKTKRYCQIYYKNNNGSINTSLTMVNDHISVH